jgi:hypothetical protein
VWSRRCLSGGGRGAPSGSCGVYVLTFCGRMANGAQAKAQAVAAKAQIKLCVGKGRVDNPPDNSTVGPPALSWRARCDEPCLL